MRGGGDVDERDRLGVEDDGVHAGFGGGGDHAGPDGVGVGEVDAGLDAQDCDARGRLVVGIARDVRVLV